MTGGNDGRSGRGGDAREVEARARRWLARASLATPCSIELLAGDASDRRFVRVRPDGRPSRVLVVHTGPIDPAALPLLQVADLFRRLPVPVPAVLDTDADLGIVVLEDLGDETFETLLSRLPAAEHDAWYRDAIALIAAIQQGGRRLAAGGGSKAAPFRLAFDTAKLLWELGFFLDHFVAGYRRHALAPAARGALEAEFRALAGQMAGEPRVLCHRDFHSRNLMAHRGRLHVIDFQDARMGPDTYDLVSLLRDAYARLDPASVDRLIAHYQALAGVADGDALRRRFRRTTVQRTLKALGTFGHQIAVRGNDRYRAAVPVAAAYAREVTGHDPRYRRLHDLLAPVLDGIGS
ncbi:MAG: phosphotransferase [Acidobacteria bacterium]|nr:phosphotransferase [Acidobacteriota bacterium]